MSRGLNMVLVIFMVAAAMFLGGAQAQTTHVVGDALGWTIPSGGAAAYTTWAAGRTFMVGDTIVFNFTTGAHTAAEVTKAAFDSCSTTSPISISTTGPANIVLQSAGAHYFLCTVPSHCALGQKLGINVSATSGSPAPQPSPATPAPAPPTATAPTVAPTVAPTPSTVPTPAPSPSRASRTYTVGDSLGWTVPTGGPTTYQAWASGKTFSVGDALVFNFANGRHNVAEVTKAAYDACNTSSPITTTTASPARITLNRAGEHYYLCTFPSHCSLGQKLAINVTGTAASAPIPSTGASPSPAGGPTAPGNPLSPPPSPGNSAPAIATSVMPVSVLAILLAFLY